MTIVDRQAASDPRGRLQHWLRRAQLLWRRPSFGLAVLWLVVVVAVALFAPLLAPYDPIRQNLGNPLAEFSMQHPLGTDDLGRDVLSRLIWGARPTLAGTLVAMMTACAIGIPWGLAAGYAGGITDQVLMRIADSILVFPGVVLALALTTAFGPVSSARWHRLASWCRRCWRAWCGLAC